MFSCVVIGFVCFGEIFVIDMVGNFIGIFFIIFMFCSIEFMFVGICINILMFWFFYIWWRKKYKLFVDNFGYVDFSIG